MADEGLQGHLPRLASSSSGYLCWCGYLSSKEHAPCLYRTKVPEDYLVLPDDDYCL